MREAALSAFAHEGYDGASVRKIAAVAGVSVSVLYHHYGNKQDLLFAILTDTTGDLARAVDAALTEAPPSPVARFCAAVRTFAGFYAERPLECRALNTEMRCLTEDNYRRHLHDRRRLQHLFDELVESGCRSGDFGVSNPKVASRVIVVMCRDIATWFDPEGPMTREQVVEQYLQMALELVEATSAVRRRVRKAREESTS